MGWRYARVDMQGIGEGGRERSDRSGGGESDKIRRVGIDSRGEND